MDRGVGIFRVKQLRLYYFFDSLLWRWRHYDGSKCRNLLTQIHSVVQKNCARQQCRCENLTSCIREYVANTSYFPTSLCDVDAFSYGTGHLVSCFLLFSWTFKSIYLFIHFVLYSNLREVLGSMSSPWCVWKLERVCSQTKLCQLRWINDYTRQLNVSAFTVHLQVVFPRT